jgi:HAD superfamily hydrolase (TIGR01509 family)
VKAGAFIFDLDGVIVDSTELHVDVWVRYLEPYGIDPRDLAERMHGKHNDDLVRDLFGNHLSADEVFVHGSAKEALYREMVLPQLRERLVPGVREFLERHAEVPKAVASNAEPANAALAQHFLFTLDGHQVERPKPFPDIYLQAAEMLGHPPGACIVFEDSPVGVSAARAAGTRVVGITTTCAHLEGADIAVRNFTDARLQEWLCQTI